MSMPHSCAIIGLGAIGMGYDRELDPEKYVFSHARALSTHPAFVLQGAVDPSPEHRRDFEKLYGLPTFPDVMHLLASSKPEVVVISSPTETHGEVLKKVLHNSLPSIILCEKPLSRDIREAREMVQMCEALEVPLFVNYPRRSDPGPLEIARRFRSGEVELPAKGMAWYSKGIYNNGSHMVNLLEMWLGPCREARSVSNGAPSSLGNDPEPDGFLAFERGYVALLSAREEHYSHYGIELVTPSGRLRYDRGGELITWEVAKPDPLFLPSRKLAENPEIIPNGRNTYQRHVVVEMAAALEGKPSSLCTGQQALQTLECIHSMLNTSYL